MTRGADPAAHRAGWPVQRRAVGAGVAAGVPRKGLPCQGERAGSGMQPAAIRRQGPILCGGLALRLPEGTLPLFEKTTQHRRGKEEREEGVFLLRRQQRGTRQFG